MHFMLLLYIVLIFLCLFCIFMFCLYLVAFFSSLFETKNERGKNLIVLPSLWLKRELILYYGLTTVKSIVLSNVLPKLSCIVITRVEGTLSLTTALSLFLLNVIEPLLFNVGL